jgi:D-alanine-D-alanine ligase
MSPERIEYIFPPQIEERLQKNIMELALKVYQAVECRDFGRVDFRVDTDGKPYVLEINPLPCLSTEDVFMIIAKNMGITYAEMIGKIVKSAVARYNLEL